MGFRMTDDSLWAEIEPPTVNCDLDFTITQLGLIVEALGLYKDLGKKLAVGFATEDGPVLPETLSLDPVAQREIHEKVMNGEAWISRTVGNTPLTEYELECLDRLMGHFIVGLSVLETKYEIALEKHAKDETPALVTAFYELLKKEGENGKDK
jgi:hypothetical protein